MAKKNTRKVRQTYSRDFKKRAVLMTMKDGVKVADVAAELGISAGYLSKWRSEHQEAGSIEAAEQKIDALAENKLLKDENKRLKMENEILKKATAFFASQK